MEFLLIPNIAYLVLMAAVLLTLLAIMTPGTGVAEILAVFALLLAGYAVYHLSFNWWALLVLMLSVVPFLYAVQTPKARRSGWRFPLSVLRLGSIFFFPAEEGWLSVNPLLAVTTTRCTRRSCGSQPGKWWRLSASGRGMNCPGLIGQQGEAKTAIGEDGAVQVAGELWSARSAAPLPAGSPVKVVGRDGFVLIVEPGQNRTSVLGKY